jgi:hypothetical protein
VSAHWKTYAEDSVKSHDTYLDRLEEAETAQLEIPEPDASDWRSCQFADDGYITSLPEKQSSTKVKASEYGTSYTKSSTPQMLSSTSSMLEIPLEHDVEVLKNISRKPRTST